MTEQNNSKHDELSTQALEAELRQMPTPQPSAKLKARLLDDIPSANPTPRLTYRLPMIRTAAAAAILMVVVGLFVWLTLGNGGASVAWGSVTQRIKQVDYVHFYEIKRRQNGLKISVEGWSSQGTVVGIKSDGTKYVDNGNILTVFDRDGFQIRQDPSKIVEITGHNFFEKMVLGWLDLDKEQFLANTPIHVGEDFLVYKLDPAERIQRWAESVSITVGRNSLLPIQIKVYRKDQENAYDLYIFDYEAPEKPAEFFEAKQRPAQGEADVVLGGEEVVISISNSPGIKAVTIRLYEKEFENMGKLKVYDATMITTEGFKREIGRNAPWKPNEELRGGSGGRNWPDKKFRHHTAKWLIKPTGQKDIYHVEANCWFDKVPD